MSTFTLPTTAGKLQTGSTQSNKWSSLPVQRVGCSGAQRILVLLWRSLLDLQSRRVCLSKCHLHRSTFIFSITCKACLQYCTFRMTHTARGALCPGKAASPTTAQDAWPLTTLVATPEYGYRLPFACTGQTAGPFCTAVAIDSIPCALSTDMQLREAKSTP